MKKVTLALCVVALVGGLMAAAVLGANRDLQEAEETAIAVSPAAISMGSQGTVVSVHTNIPYGAVDKASLTLNDVEIAWTKSDTLGYLVAKFNLDDVKAIVSAPSSELTLTGVLLNGTPFAASDTVAVRD